LREIAVAMLAFDMHLIIKDFVGRFAIRFGADDGQWTTSVVRRPSSVVH